MRLNNMNMADIMAFIDDECYELEEKAEKIFDYITGLENKLAESEKLNKELYNEKESAEKILRMSSDEQTIEILALKQQLAEKDKIYVESLIKLEKESEEQLEKQATIHYRHLKEKDQDKIDFAVELLEQVRQEIAVKDKIGLRLFIDGKIKEIREMK